MKVNLVLVWFWYHSLVNNAYCSLKLLFGPQLYLTFKKWSKKWSFAVILVV